MVLGVVSLILFLVRELLHLDEGLKKKNKHELKTNMNNHFLLLLLLLFLNSELLVEMELVHFLVLLVAVFYVLHSIFFILAMQRIKYNWKYFQSLGF